ncbi:hypothetical protein ASG22_09430 [Chryseobacterium sp. Leaf405]|uniref:hypothetical protein n=1 Tax=Chryseobacterium sp. Leaf405 TaxID=1736367 RepID=UPI0006F78DB5|nr:hypothetical protein [Chryseobacterium sp. Leaf405]KQT24227.1 hypothetical protein ASG22_09430 [Chryseobacterium sp. Leaf405]
MKNIFLLLIFTTQFYVLGQEIKMPDNFIEKPIPTLESEEWYSLNHAGYYYYVKMHKGKLIAEKSTEEYNAELKIPEGKLIAENNGEWGGKLYFQPKNSLKRIEVKSGNIVDIFKFKNKIYIVEGLAHMGSSSGAIYELIRQDNEFIYKKILNFENDAPVLLTNFRNKVYMVSDKNFYEIDLRNGTSDKILENQFWRGLYPQSIVIFDEKNIFVGIRGGIVKINAKDKTMNFYTDKK